MLLISRGVEPWDRRGRRCQRDLYREGNISAWPWGPVGWKAYLVREISMTLLWRSRTCLRNKEVCSVRLTYGIQWGVEKRIIEGKAGDIVQGHSLHLMVRYVWTMTNYLVQGRRDSLYWWGVAAGNPPVKALFGLRRETYCYNPLWKRCRKSDCDFADINLRFPSKGWT